MKSGLRITLASDIKTIDTPARHGRAEGQARRSGTARNPYDDFREPKLPERSDISTALKGNSDKTNERAFPRAILPGFWAIVIELREFSGRQSRSTPSIFYSGNYQ